MTTQSDREMLEMAAKAAGYPFGTVNDKPQAKIVQDIGTCGTWGCGKHQWRDWNPLTDDGDALRLAVKLNLRLVFHPVLIQAIVKPYLASDDSWRENGEDHADHCAATRRAIVRAAAEIGRHMP